MVRLEAYSSMLICSTESVATLKLLAALYCNPLGLRWWSQHRSLVCFEGMYALLGSDHVKPRHEPIGQQIQAVNVVHVHKAAFGA